MNIHDAGAGNPVEVARRRWRCADFLLGAVPELATLVGLPAPQAAAAAKDPLVVAQDLAVAVAAVDTLADWIAAWWDAWRVHPDYPASCAHDPADPEVVAVFSHPPGKKGCTESYVIAPLADATSPNTRRWAQRTWDGRLARIDPISDDIPVSPYYTGFISNGLKGAGQAYQARQRLRELLPPQLRPLISRARSWAARPKWWFLPPTPEVHPRQRSTWPVWYTQATKAQLIIEHKLFDDDKQRQQLERYIDAEAFYRAASGQVHPDDVAPLFRTYQLALPLE